jgi:ferredoxin--NADP+ reductase
VIPPGNREKDGKPHSVRLYSIASSRYGDDMTGKTGSLCVRRATYWCDELKADDPAKKGVCSNFLCDSTPGTEVVMTGPAGKVMLMPEEDPTTDYIMVATGTGIAPYRGFVRRLFVEDTPAASAYKGEAWLFLGVANSDALLYDDEFQEAKSKYPDNFRIDYALSREQENKSGGKMYIQDKVEEYSDEIFEKKEPTFTSAASRVRYPESRTCLRLLLPARVLIMMSGSRNSSPRSSGTLTCTK